ncbi:unannotated protein [freshwater metagenome]|uniref:Unannotated protein n=1 Tax=freshwater metagenome TaxID=449393 RepID=A0A6J7HQ87_9ZZZZ
MCEYAVTDRDTVSMRWITARRSAFDHDTDACPTNSATADSTASTNPAKTGSDTTGAGGTVSMPSTPDPPSPESMNRIYRDPPTHFRTHVHRSEGSQLREISDRAKNIRLAGRSASLRMK